MTIPWKQEEKGLPIPVTSESKKNATLNLLDGLGSHSSSTSLRASLTRRRTVIRLIFGTLLAWASLYWALTCWGYFAVDVLKNGAGPLSSEALIGLEVTTKPSEDIGTTIIPLEMPESERIIEGSKNGYTGPDPEHLVHGLPLATKNPVDIVPSSGLGAEADLAYNWGPTTLTEYRQDLDSFIVNHFPRSQHEVLRRDLERYLDSTSVPELNDLPGLGANGVSRQIYMTDKDERKLGEYRVSTWRDNRDGWGFNFMDDRGAQRFVDEELGETRMKDVWDGLPNGILRSDMLRYTLLYLKGGIYTDTDTSLLKNIADWGEDPDLYRQGRGWLFPEDRQGEPTEEEKTELKRGLKRASVVVGIESDVGDREDWHDWWPRPLQIVQWTLGSAPHHPIFLDTLLGITRSTAAAYEWERDQHSTHRPPAAAAVAANPVVEKPSPPTLTSEPSEGGPVGIMEWTGPGVWTDSVLRYLRIKYGVRWTDLRRLAKPLRVGEVVILPITGFSPGVGNFGAMSAKHSQAMVEHHFAGSWKHKTSEHG